MSLEKYITAWKNEEAFRETKLTQEEIEQLLRSRSKTVINLFKRGLLFDIVLKIILIISFIPLAVYYASNNTALILIIVSLSILISGTFFQFMTKRKIPKRESFSLNIANCLHSIIQFYRKNYTSSLIIGSLSNTFIVLSGFMYYFFIKYDGFRTLDLTDCLVFGSILLLSFILSFQVQKRHYNFHIKQSELCLEEINEDSITEFKVNQYKNKKQRLLFAVIIALIAGLLLLSFFIFQA